MGELEGIQYLEFLIRVMRMLALIGVVRISAILKKLNGKWNYKEAEG